MRETLTAWKARLQVGTQVCQIWNSSQGGEVSHVFTVTEVQTNGVFGVRDDLDRRVWLEFPKRSGIVFTDKGWIRVDGTRKIAEYEWIEQQQQGKEGAH